MIEIIREEDWGHTQEKSLPKDIRQMGRTDIGDRIYVEDLAYHFLHPYDNPGEKTAYVLLGKFENYSGRQCTFVEAAIRLEEVSFEGELPLWNDNTWAYIYKQLKREYDSMVIVGWAMDIKGQQANMTARMEALHQNNFGGTHQILFLMDSLEGEEAFYGSRNGRMSRREGFYIYYDKNQCANLPPITKHEERLPESTMSEADNEWEKQAQERAVRKNNLEKELQPATEEKVRGEKWYKGENSRMRGGNYRKQVIEREERKGAPSYASSFVLLAVICVLGFAAYTNHRKMQAMEETLARMNGGAAMATEQTETGAVNVETVAGNVTKQEESESQPSETTTTETGTSAGGDLNQIIVESETVSQSSATGSEAEPAMTEAQTYLAQGYYMVQKGDTLVSICKKIYQTTAMMDQLCEVNDIEDQDSIYAGQKLILPN